MHTICIVILVGVWNLEGGSGEGGAYCSVTWM